MVKNIVEAVLGERPVEQWRHISGGYRQVLLVDDDGVWSNMVRGRFKGEELHLFEQQLHDMLVCTCYI